MMFNICICAMFSLRAIFFYRELFKIFLRDSFVKFIMQCLSNYCELILSFCRKNDMKPSKARTAHTLILGEWSRMLGVNRWTSNVLISAFVCSRYSSLFLEYILGTSKFAELMNISEYRLWKSVLVITHQFMQEHAGTLTNIWYSLILCYFPRINVCEDSASCTTPCICYIRVCCSCHIFLSIVCYFPEMKERSYFVHHHTHKHTKVHFLKNWILTIVSLHKYIMVKAPPQVPSLMIHMCRYYISYLPDSTISKYFKSLCATS